MHRLLRLLPALLLTHGLWAHQVPNMTIEAEFAASGDYTLRINLDPRIFLSRQPTALPPVTADWYLNQSATEKAQTHAQAADYLQSNLELHFGTQRTEVPGCDFVALDGATSEALKPDTAETHLLATARGRVPAGADSFLLDFGPEANVSLILLNSLDGQPERRPQVLFPGESSRAFPIPAARAEPAAVAVQQLAVRRVIPIGGWLVPAGPLLAGATGLILLLAAGLLLRRRKRR